MRHHIFKRTNMKMLAATSCMLLVSAAARGQEAMYTAAATMPSPGVSVLRPQVNYSEYGTNPSDGTASTTRVEVVTSLQIGIIRDLSFTLDVPVEFDRRVDRATGGVDHDTGVEDLGLTFKYRFYKNDTGGIDTIRAAVMGGAYVASGDDNDYSSMTINPHLGLVLTIVTGRHGFNFEVDYRLNTGGGEERNIGGGEGSADALFHNISYLYRIFPDRYTSESTGAWYVTAELNGLYETNGDYEVRWAPGIMYEGRDFALELMAQLPVFHDVRERAELDFSVGVGVRVTF